MFIRYVRTLADGRWEQGVVEATAAQITPQDGGLFQIDYRRVGGRDCRQMDCERVRVFTDGSLAADSTWKDGKSTGERLSDFPVRNERPHSLDGERSEPFDETGKAGAHE